VVLLLWIWIPALLVAGRRRHAAGETG
jgi:hypothetical protein